MASQLVLVVLLPGLFRKQDWLQTVSFRVSVRSSRFIGSRFDDSPISFPGHHQSSDEESCDQQINPSTQPVLITVSTSTLLERTSTQRTHRTKQIQRPGVSECHSFHQR